MVPGRAATNWLVLLKSPRKSCTKLSVGTPFAPSTVTRVAAAQRPATTACTLAMSADLGVIC